MTKFYKSHSSHNNIRYIMFEIISPTNADNIRLIIENQHVEVI